MTKMEAVEMLSVMQTKLVNDFGDAKNEKVYMNRYIAIGIAIDALINQTPECQEIQLQSEGRYIEGGRLEFIIGGIWGMSVTLAVLIISLWK